MGIWDIVNCKERMENFELSRATLKYLILLLVHVGVVVVVIIVISVWGTPKKGIQHSQRFVIHICWREKYNYLTYF